MLKKVKPWWIVLAVIVLVFAVRSLHGSSYELQTTVTLWEGETVAEIYTDMNWKERLVLKRYFSKHEDSVLKIQPGSYVFSGTYAAADILDIFLEGPTVAYEHITLLEWRSIYDVDASLSAKWLIQPGEYIGFVSDVEIIDRYRQRYAFLAQAFTERDTLVSLEGYLYPDTYFVDKDKNIIDQLVFLQLEWFNTKIRWPYGDQLVWLTSRLSNLWYDFSLSTYGALIMASIVEKEERVDANRPSITSVFYNRLQEWMQIDADISLCYGLKQPYETCTPAVIVENLYDKTNPYNTRAVWWIPPSPIVTPTASSVSALLTAEPSPWFYYLHAPDGTLHLARTLWEHNNNKSKYLSR